MNRPTCMRIEDEHAGPCIKEEPLLFDFENSKRVQIEDNQVQTEKENREICQLYIKEEKLSSDEESNVDDDANRCNNAADSQEMNKVQDYNITEEKHQGCDIKEEPFLYDLENSEKVEIKYSIVSSKEGKREICQQIYIKEEELSSDESDVENNINKHYDHNVADSQQINVSESLELGMSTSLPVFTKEENNIDNDDKNPDDTAEEISHRKMKVDDNIDKHFLCNISEDLQCISNNSHLEELQYNIYGGHSRQIENQTKLQHPELINVHGNEKPQLEYQGKCMQCKYLASSPKKLDYHRKYACSKKKIYECFFCSYKGRQKSELRSHIIRKHSFGETVIECPHCKFMSLSFLEVQDHVSKKHNKPKKYYYCSQCEFKCLSKFGVDYHEAAKHTHQKNYACTLCENKYIHACGLRQHMLRIHKIKIPYNKRKSRSTKY